jgi:tetratricopeptide (TPR) repeat protein
MQQGMPTLALKWFNRTLETNGLLEEEKQALWYEVGAAYELDGDVENAAKYFELVYAENVNFRDVRNRVKSVMASH